VFGVVLVLVVFREDDEAPIHKRKNWAWILEILEPSIHKRTEPE
jgi:hypothetical protein